MDRYEVSLSTKLFIEFITRLILYQFDRIISTYTFIRNVIITVKVLLRILEAICATKLRYCLLYSWNTPTNKLIWTLENVDYNSELFPNKCFILYIIEADLLN